MGPNLLFSVVLVAAASLGHQYENFIWTSGYCRQDGDADAEVSTTASSLGHGTDEWCAARCNEDPSCVAWDNCGSNCWLHGAPRSTGVAGAGCECWVKGVSDRYVHIPAACVSANNIELHKGKTVAECAAICDANANCLAFEYGVDHGGSGTYYEAGDCQEQSSAEVIDYDCTSHNLDLYVKDIVYVDQTSISGYFMGDSTIRTAVDAWLSNPTAAEATYGHISTWETAGVTDMSYLFCGLNWPSFGCYSAAASFNEDIGAWDTSGVTTMYNMFREASSFKRYIGGWRVDKVTDMGYMFHGASAFNHPIGDWRVDSVKSMHAMFHRASAFDQDLGWCIRNGADIDRAFKRTKCESTSCGVAMRDVVGICEPWAHPCLIGTDEQCDINSPTLIIIIIIVLVLLAGVCVHWRRKKDETYIAAACRLLCCRSKTEPSSVNTRPDSPAESPPEEATVPKETEATAVAPEAEESPQETTLDELPPPPAKSWFRRAKPESEEAEQPPPLSPFSALRAERERELKMLANP